MLTMDDVARMIDHSILLLATTDVDLVQGVEICKRHGVGCLVPKVFGCGQRATCISPPRSSTS
jgi:deoxyribose-phosphate aldolase